MKSILALAIALAFTFLTACSSSQDRAYKAQEKVHEERLELVEKYNKCMKDAGDDAQKKEGCEQYLKAAEALK